jgi:hypothetical protein
MSAPLQTFVIHAPDYATEGTFEKRMSVRATHQVRMKELIGAGTIRAYPSGAYRIRNKEHISVRWFHAFAGKRPARRAGVGSQARREHVCG